MVIPLSAIKPLKKPRRRERAKYWRPLVQDGKVVWMQTDLLPSDAEGKEYYQSKGFRLAPPSENSEREDAIAETERQAMAARLQELESQVIAFPERMRQLEHELSMAKADVGKAKADVGKAKAKRVRRRQTTTGLNETVKEEGT